MNMDIFAALMRGLLVTAQITIGAWAIAFGIGILLALLNEVGQKAVKAVVQTIAHMLRAIPNLVLLYLIYFGLLSLLPFRISPILAACIALGIAESGTAMEYLRGALATVSSKQRLAAASFGFSGWKTFRLIVMPQAVPVSIPPLLTMFLLLMKVATLASAVVAPEILYAARENMIRTGEMFVLSSTVLVIYLCITLPLTLAVYAIERKIRGASKRRRAHYASAA